MAIDPGPSLNRIRIFAACGILLAVEIAVFLFLAAGTHGLIVKLAKPTSTDFVSFYAAGSLADAGTPQLAYDQAAHYAAEQQATKAGITYNYFFYPPVFLLVCAALARLPYMIAFVFFEAGTLLLYLYAATRILAYRSIGSNHPVVISAHRGEREGTHRDGENEVGDGEHPGSPTSPRPSPPPGAERERLTTLGFEMRAHPGAQARPQNLPLAGTGNGFIKFNIKSLCAGLSHVFTLFFSCSAPSDTTKKSLCPDLIGAPTSWQPVSSDGPLAERGWGLLLPLLAFPPVLWTIGLGQNALLTAALFGAATLLVDRRPVVAGLLFGALCYKPHLGLLVPVALIAGRRWPALIAAGLSVAALSLLSLILFGPQTWQAFLTAMTVSRTVYETGRITFAGYVTPFGAVMLRGGTPAIAYLVQAAATVAAGAFVATVWRRGLPLPVRAATLAAATLAAVPLALFYDLMLAGVAGLWLLRADGAYCLPNWGKVVLAVLFILTLDPRGLAQAWRLPVGPAAALGLTALVVAMVIRGRAAARTGLAADPVRAAPHLAD